MSERKGHHDQFTNDLLARLRNAPDDVEDEDAVVVGDPITDKKSFFKRITPGILDKMGPGREGREVSEMDKHKVVGPPAAKNAILDRPTQGTCDMYDAAQAPKLK